MGDGRWYDVLAIHNSIVRSNLLRARGTEIKSQGDGFMLSFPSARRGLQFAVDVQRAMTRWANDHPDEGVRIRMGLHTGEALISADGDLFGKHVIVAARVANLADGGEILVSGVTREIASNRSDFTFDEGRTVSLKGIDGPYTVYALDWS
jgi:class 3 adenylate cyclase